MKTRSKPLAIKLRALMQTGDRPGRAFTGFPDVECLMSNCSGTMPRRRWPSMKAFHFAMLLCALLAAALGDGRAQAQSIIAIEPASTIEDSGTSFTWAHTVGSGIDRFLVVSIAIERDNDRVIAASYAGQPMTFLGTITDANGATRVEAWGLVSPSTGTNTVSVALNGTAAIIGAAISFANVDQTNPISASQFASGTNAFTASASVASDPDEVVLAVLSADDNVDNVTAGAGQASRWNRLNAFDVIGAGSTITGSATTTMSYALNDNQEWAMGVLSIRASKPLVVTNTNDSGTGSLRNAIEFANTQAGPSTITFAIPGGGPHTILLTSELPRATANDLLIDGTTQPGTQCRDLWTGSGHDLRINVRGNVGFDGFRLSGANQTIRGLSVTGFLNAIRLRLESSAATVQCNYLGLLADGSINGNTRGVWVRGTSGLIGGTDNGAGNVISANAIVGVLTANESADTSIQGNFIGTDATGMTTLGNGTAINNFFGAATWRDITRNLISGNTLAGIELETDDQIGPSTDLVRIQRNIIGFTRDLSALMRNGGDGIRFPSGSISNVLIGGDADTQGNHISGTGEGISLNNTPDSIISGNVIARSGQNGIRVTATNGVTIGGNSASLGNIIGGNGWSGIAAVDGSSNVSILGNTIGAVTITGGTFENQDRGIFLRNVSNVSVGDGTAGGRNIIGGNGGRAINGLGNNSNITINGNYVGTDATGNVAVVNGAGESGIARDAISFDQGGSISNLAILNNVIGGYEASLIELWNSTGNGFTIQGNNVGVGADGISPIVSGNLEDLIHVGGGGSYANLLIGGAGAGQGNLIAFGNQSGIQLDNSASNLQVIGNTIHNNARNGIDLLNSTRAAIVSNRMFANGLLGIDLGDDGVTANDPGDGDSGPNDLLNFSEITGMNILGPNQLGYSFTLDAPAVANGYRIEFFASDAPDPSGHGEGERYLGHVDITHAGGTLSYTGTLTTLEPVSVGDIISSTTTRRTADGAWDITSEFSAVATADGVAALTVAMTSEVFDPPADNPFATPGQDILLTTTVSNVGTGSTDADSIFVAIAIDAANTFSNAATPALGDVVGFTSAAPALAFDPASDLAFSSAAAAPTSFDQCTYTPATGYDPQVRHVCLNPKGTLPNGEAQGQFAVQIRVRIN